MRTLLFFVTALAAFQLTFAATQVEVCPSNSSYGLHLASIFTEISCPNATELECAAAAADNINVTKAALVTNKQKEWILFKDVISHLPTRCSMEAVLVDLTRNQLMDFDYGCDPTSETERIVVFDATGSVAMDYSSFTKCRTIQLNDYDPLVQVGKHCHETIWVSGEPVKCSSVHSSKLVVINVTLLENIARSKSIVVGTIKYPPFVDMVTFNDTVTYTGITFEIIRRLAKDMGFSYEVVIPPNNAYGIATADNVWDGGMGMLQRREIDIFAGGITITYNRSLVADFSAPFDYGSVGILVTKPPPFDTFWQWIMPFSGPVWGVVISSALVGGFFLYILHLKAPYKTQTGFEKCGNCHWYLMSGLMNQGSEIHPVTFSAMVFLSFWWLYCVAIMAVYSGGLVAIMTTQKPSLPMNTLSDLMDLAEEGDMKLCIMGSTSFHAAVLDKESRDKQFARIRALLEVNPSYIKPTYEHCARLMLADSKVAMISEVTTLETIKSANCQNVSLIILEDRFFPTNLGFAFPKESPFTELINSKILKMYETGLIAAWKANETAGSTTRCAEDTDGSDATVSKSSLVLRLTDIIGILVILAVGSAISILAFATEKIYALCAYGRSVRPTSDRNNSNSDSTSPTAWGEWKEPEWSNRISPIFKRKFGQRAFYMRL